MKVRARRRLVPALAALALVAGCSSDDVRTAVTDARTNVTVPTVPTAPTIPTVTAPTIPTVTTPPVTVATATTTTTTDQTTSLEIISSSTVSKVEDDAEDSILPIILVLIGAILIVALFIALWRRARREPGDWEQRRQSAAGVARWAATDLPPGLLDPGRSPDDRRRAWAAQRPELTRTARELSALAQEARRQGDRDAVGAIGVALTALEQALDAHVASGTADAAALVQLRARDLLDALERRTS